MTDYDIILGMDWLSTHHAVIDYRKKHVRFQPLKAKSFEFQGTPRKRAVPMISALKARKLLSSECKGFLASIVDPNKETELTPDDVLVVRDYISVFLKDLLGFPPDREIMFSIELVLGIAPISGAPYRLVSADLKELKVQPKEMIEKGFIWPRHSPWGAPVLFVKKKG